MQIQSELKVDVVGKLVQLCFCYFLHDMLLAFGLAMWLKCFFKCRITNSDGLFTLKQRAVSNDNRTKTYTNESLCLGWDRVLLFWSLSCWCQHKRDRPALLVGNNGLIFVSEHLKAELAFSRSARRCSRLWSLCNV